MKLDFKGMILKGLNKEDAVEDPSKTPPKMFTYANVTARMLLEKKAEDPIKILEMTESLHDTESLDLDTSDLELVKTKVKESEGFSAIFSGQILRYIKNVELHKDDEIAKKKAEASASAQ